MAKTKEIVLRVIVKAPAWLSDTAIRREIKTLINERSNYLSGKQVRDKSGEIQWAYLDEGDIKAKKVMAETNEIMNFNKRRLRTLIKVMQRVVNNKRPFDLTVWQDKALISKTEKKLHECGTSACVAGYLAVSPEFKRAGGAVDFDGSPIFNGVEQYQALANFLQCRESLASLIASPEQSQNFYGKIPYGLTAKDVVKRLTILLETGE